MATDEDASYKHLTSYAAYLDLWRYRFEKLVDQFKQEEIDTQQFIAKTKPIFLVVYFDDGDFGESYQTLVRFMELLVTRTLQQVGMTEEQIMDEGVKMKMDLYDEQCAALASATRPEATKSRLERMKTPPRPRLPPQLGSKTGQNSRTIFSNIADSGLHLPAPTQITA
ncbi:hypothetical protein PG995_012969 [Apiospora arundinis]